MVEVKQVSALQMNMVVDVVVDLVVAAVAEETLEGEEAVAEVEEARLAGLVTGPAPAAATTALLASTQSAHAAVTLYTATQTLSQSTSESMFDKLDWENVFADVTEQDLQRKF